MGFAASPRPTWCQGSKVPADKSGPFPAVHPCQQLPASSTDPAHPQHLHNQWALLRALHVPFLGSPHLPPAGKQDASLRDCNSSRNNVTPKSSHLGQDSGVSPPKCWGLSACCREQSQAGALSREGPPAPPGNPQLKAAQRAKCPSASTVCNGAGCHSAGTASVQLCRVCFCQRDGCAKRPSAGTVCNGTGCCMGSVQTCRVSASLVSVHGAPPPAR